MNTAGAFSTFDVKIRSARNTFALGLLLLVANIVEFILAVRQGLIIDNSLLGSLAGTHSWVALLTVLAALAAIWLSRNEQQERASYLMGAALIVGALVTDLVYAGLGLGLAFTTLLFMLALAGLTLTGGRARLVGLIGVLAAAGLLGLDLLLPPGRPRSPLASLLPYIDAAMLLAVGGIMFEWFRGTTLRTKMTFAFMLATAIGLAFISIYANQAISSALTADTGGAMHSFAVAHARTVANLIDKEVDMLIAVGLSDGMLERAEVASRSYTGDAGSVQSSLLNLDQQWRTADAANNDNDPLVRAVLTSQPSASLRSFRANFPENAEVFFTDKYGALLSATNRTTDYYQADEDWWKAAYADGVGATFIGQPEFDEGSRIQSIIIAVPLYARESHDLVGIMRTTLRLAFVREALAAGDPTIQIDLIFPDNQMLSAENSIGGQVDLEALGRIRASNEPYLSLSYQGSPALLAAVPVSGSEHEPETDEIVSLGWLLVAHRDQSEALAPVAGATRGALGVALIALAAAFAAALALAQLISQPIVQLTSTITRISEGDLSAQAPVDSNDEIGALAGAFNVMTGRLRDTVARMEQRVIERTADLRAEITISERRATLLQSVSEVARAIASAQEQSSLLVSVVQMIGRQFGFYHVGIYLFDAAREYAVLTATNSEGGRKMLGRGDQHRIGEATAAGAVARTGDPRIALDIGPEAVNFEYPDLPNTRSQMILPLKVGDRIIGLLDLQSDQSLAFQNEDAQVFGALANHVAIAIENARSYSETHRTLEEAQRAYQIYVKREWALMADRREQSGYRFAGSKLEPINGGPEQPEYGIAAETGELQSSTSTLAIPLRLRGETIGVIGVHVPGSSRQWSESEIALIQAAADRVALTLENARLLQEAQRLAAKERAIGEITTRISASSEMDHILQIAAQELARTLGGTEVVIQFQDRSTE